MLCIISLFATSINFALFGYGIAFKDTEDSTRVERQYLFMFGLDRDQKYAHWTKQFVIAATIGPIIAGAMAERVKIFNFYAFSSIMAGLVYPVVLASTWGGGWLYKLGFRDSAGASIIHLVGGTAGFVGTYLMGPRLYKKHKKFKVKSQKNLKNGYEIVAQKVRNKEWNA